jgi:tryptophan synthase alpha chain
LFRDDRVSMSNIEGALARLKREGRKGVIPFIVAGHPDLITTRDLLIEFGRAGAAVIELGIPFSDPMADGPVIQRASDQALQRKFGIAEVLSLVADVRKVSDTPLVLFSYLNPLFQYGFERLADDARAAGVDGVLVTDLVTEESDEFASCLGERQLDLIFLVAPTSSDERIESITKRASGFVYAVSRLGVTGAQSDLSSEAEVLVNRVRRFTDLPVAIGFGISDARQVAEVWTYADAAVIGSAIVAEIERFAGKTNLVKEVGEYYRSLIPGI